MKSDLELEIGAGQQSGSYQVRVVHAAAGGEPTAKLELDVAGLLRRRELLEATVLASAVPARRSMSATEQPVHQVGQELFDAVFSGRVYGSYRASLGAAQQRGERLRVVLRLTAPELAVLPWEALLDPETGTYLCRREPLVRHVSADYTPEPLEVVLPLRILALVASPRGLPMLDVEAEQRHLVQALAAPIESGQVELTWLTQASWGTVHERLLSGEWHILHFVGHGDYDTTTEEGLLALVGADGRADLVEASRLADLLNEAQPTPRLVVLNSCSSGEAGTSDLFSGTAAALVHSGINAVAAMQFSVSDSAAIAFARGFYTALAHGRDVDEAARSGRIEILGARGTLEWVTPVLYVRGEATKLFNLSGLPPLLRTPEGSAPQERVKPDPSQEQAVHVFPPPEVHQEEAQTSGSRQWALIAVLAIAVLIVAVAVLGILALSSQRTPAPTPTAAPAPVTPSALPGTPCGGDGTVSVGPNTTCAFAANVEATFRSAGSQTAIIKAFSPATGRVVTMNCVAGTPSVCRGGNNAIVFIR